MEQPTEGLSTKNKSVSLDTLQTAISEKKKINVPSKAKVPKRVRHAEAIRKAELYAARNLPKYLAKLHELAMGIYLADFEDGEMVVYQTKPDLNALKVLVERGMGKVVEQVEITGGEDSTMVIVPWRIPKED